MNANKTLEERIEELRAEMHKIYQKNPTDQKLLQVSQKLDSLLNQYRR